MKNAFFISGFFILLLLAYAFPITAQSKSQEISESDILSLDENTKKTIIKELIQPEKSNSEKDPAALSSAGTSDFQETTPYQLAIVATYPPIVNPSDHSIRAAAIEFPVRQKKVPQERFITPEEMAKRTALEITGQHEDHLLITVGDVVYLTSPSDLKTLSQEKNYAIYKRVERLIPEVSSQPLAWYEPVGCLEIMEVHPQLSMARITAAQDIIKKGDLVVLHP